MKLQATSRGRLLKPTTPRLMPRPETAGSGEDFQNLYTYPDFLYDSGKGKLFANSSGGFEFQVKKDDNMPYIFHRFGTIPMLLIAACCASAYAQNWKHLDYFCDSIKKPFFIANAKGEFCTQRIGENPEKFFISKPAGVKRIFIIGESTAQRLGPGKLLLENQSFNVPLFKGGKDPMGVPPPKSTGMEIINCGRDAYESHRIYDVLKEVLNYAPDLVVVLSGNNERQEEPCPGFRFELRRRKLRLLERYYALKYDSPEAKKKASFKIHEGMLIKMARAAKQAGVPIVFCTLPGNVRDWLLSETPWLSNDAAHVQVTNFFFAKKYHDALKMIGAELVNKPQDVFLTLYMAKTLEKLGRTGEAKSLFLRTHDQVESNMDGVAGRERNELIRRVAKSEGACVADLEKFFYGISPGGLPGFSEFMDSMHWRQLYNKPVWNEIIRSAGACGIKGFEGIKLTTPKESGESPREEALKRLSYAFSWLDKKNRSEAALSELTYIKQTVPSVLSEASLSPEKLSGLLLNNFWSAEGQRRIKESFPFFLSHLAETERRLGNYSAARLLCDRALAIAPGDDSLWLERAQILASSGKLNEADRIFQKLQAGSSVGAQADSLRRAYDIPIPADKKHQASANNVKKSRVLSNSAVEKMRISDYTAAKKLLVKALDFDPLNPEALIDLCVILAKEDKTEEALKACLGAANAVYGNPANRLPGFEMLAKTASLYSYKLLNQLGRKDEAKEILHRSINEIHSIPGQVSPRPERH